MNEETVTISKKEICWDEVEIEYRVKQ